MIKANLISPIIAIMVWSVSLAAKPLAMPDWYLKLQPRPNEIIGYGMHNSIEAAKAAARKDIATSIEIRVSSDNEFSTLEINGKVEEKAQILIKEHIDVYLESVYTVKDSLIQGTYFVALGYDNSPLVNKLASALNAYRGSQDTQNTYLRQCPLIGNLNRILEGSPDLRLIRANRRWWLSYREISFPLGALDVQQLFTPVNSSQLDLKSSLSSPLLENSRFSLWVTGAYDGYYSLVNVYENGEVFILEANRHLKAEEKWSYPDPRADYELISGLILPGKGTHDLYAAIYSPNPIDLSSFGEAGSELQTDEYHNKFGELIDLLGRKDLAFETIVLHTKPRPR
jgi:hypothetical protein